MRIVCLLGHRMGGFAVSLYSAKYPDKSSCAAVCDTIGLFVSAPAGLDPNIFHEILNEYCKDFTIPLRFYCLNRICVIQ